ncbi:MAG: 5'-3' exonuclease H3TH domain-containing protein [Ferruginibacter sp.]
MVIDMLGLMGDAVDNIPGGKGIGEKTLPNFIGISFLDSILTTMQIRSKGSVGEKVKLGKDMAVMR